MPVDIKYIGGDNAFEDGNYLYTSGCSSRFARALSMEETVIDGIRVGNGGYAALRREGNTASNRAIWNRYCEDVGKYFVESGQASDVVVFSEGEGGTVRTKVRFKDLIKGRTVEISTFPPWSV